MPDPTHLTRRRFLLGLGAFGALTVGVRAIDAPPPSSPAPHAPPPTLPPTTATTNLVPTSTISPPPEPTSPPVERALAAPPPNPYQPDPRDVYREVKEPAGRFVQVLAGPDGSPAERVAEVVGESAASVTVGELEPLAAPLLEPPGSVAEIVYAQLGGLAPQADPVSASVMVLVRRTWDSGSSEVRTVDVRLQRLGERWRVSALASAGGTPVPRPGALSRAAEAVLDDPRILLPDSARWDIHSGGVDERLLLTMEAMAERTPYAVTCLRNGHPVRVFGTDRTSHHTRGAAVDVWGVAGTLVAAQQPGREGAAYDLHRWLFEEGVGELGGPWAFDGGGGRSFTNPVHLDHLHVAFRG